jgi:hypothetical protein
MTENQLYGAFPHETEKKVLHTLIRGYALSVHFSVPVSEQGQANAW